MNVPVSDAKAKLADLVRRAEGGEEVVLTRHGRPAVRLEPVGRGASVDPAHRGRLIREMQARVHARISPTIDAARSQDFLYDDDGLPA